jgi:hypothetical protein
MSLWTTAKDTANSLVAEFQEEETIKEQGTIKEQEETTKELGTANANEQDVLNRTNKGEIQM